MALTDTSKGLQHLADKLVHASAGEARVPFKDGDAPAVYRRRPEELLVDPAGDVRYSAEVPTVKVTHMFQAPSRGFYDRRSRSDEVEELGAMNLRSSIAGSPGHTGGREDPGRAPGVTLGSRWAAPSTRIARGLAR